MNEKTKNALQLVSQLLWEGAIFLGKSGVLLASLAFIPSIIKDIADKRDREARINNK